MSDPVTDQSLRVQYMFLQAAVRHAQRPEVQQEPKAAVLEYLHEARMRMIKLGHHSIPISITSLIRSIETLGSVNAARRVLRDATAHLSFAPKPEHTPASNTGVTPAQLSMLEEYVNGRS